MRTALYLLLPWLLALIGLLSGCSKNSPIEPAVRLLPVSTEESRMIQIRLKSGQATLPFDELGGNSEAKECQQFKLKLPPTIRRGYIEVPENWDKAGSQLIRIFYFFHLPDGMNYPALPLAPVLILGDHFARINHSNIDTLLQSDAAKQLPLVFFDQRGTGCSSALPHSKSAASAKRLALYGSRSIVRDAEAIRKHLFEANSRWKVFAEGYGETIAERYQELAPQSLEGVFLRKELLNSRPLDAITDVGERSPTSPKEKVTLDRLQIKARAAEDFFGRYPSDRDALSRIRAAIPDSRCFEDGVHRICGPAILDGLAVFLDNRDSWDKLHYWIGALTPIGPQIGPGILENFVRVYVFGYYAQNRLLALISEEFDLTPSRLSPALCRRVLGSVESPSGEKPNSILGAFNECNLVISMASMWDPSGLDRFENVPQTSTFGPRHAPVRVTVYSRLTPEGQIWEDLGSHD